MGLDAVELMMELEDHFEIALPDSDCERVRTVADLVALVTSRLVRPPGVCATGRAFYELRSRLVQKAGVPRPQVRPSARLEPLFSSQLRRRWGTLRYSYPALPPLVVHRTIDAAFLWSAALSILAGVPVVAAVWVKVDIVVGVLAAIFLLALVVAMFRASLERRSRLPCGIETVADLVRTIAPTAAATGAPSDRALVEQRVLDDVRRIVARMVNLPPEKVRPESHLHKDLGLG